MAQYEANIKLGVTGLPDLDNAIGKVNKLQQAINAVAGKLGLGPAFKETRQLASGFDQVAKSIRGARQEYQQFAQLMRNAPQAPQPRFASPRPELRQPRALLPPGPAPLQGRYPVLPEAPRSTGNFNQILDRLAGATTSFTRAQALLRALPESRITTDLAGRASAQRRGFESVPALANAAAASRYFDPVLKEIAQTFAKYQRELRPTANDRRAIGAIGGVGSEAFAVAQRFAVGQDKATFALSRRLLPAAEQFGALPPGRASGNIVPQFTPERNQPRRYIPSAEFPTIDVQARRIDVQTQRVAQATQGFANAVQQGTRQAQAATGGGGGRRPPPPPPRPPAASPPPPPEDPRFRAAGGAGAGGRAAAQSRSRLLGTISSGVIGGGFPLLFGQGAGAGAGGALGGLLGGALGGAGGFAGGILGSLIGTQLDKLAQGATAAGNALKDPVEGLQALKDAAVFAGKEQEFLVDKLIALGRISEAQAIIQQQIIEKIGVQGNNDLLALADASTELAKAWGELSLQMQAALAGPLAGLLNWLADVIKVVGGANRDLAQLGDVREALKSNPALSRQFEKEFANTYQNQPLFGEGTSQKLQKELVEKYAALVPPPTARTPELSPANTERQLDAAIEQRKTATELERRQVALGREADDYRRDQEEAIFSLRKRATQFERDVADFRLSLEDKIFAKRQDNERATAELVRQQAQNRIDGFDLLLRGASRGPDAQGSQIVDAVRQYIKVRAEGEADLQQRETQNKLDIAQIQRDSDKFSLEVNKKIQQLRETADDYSRSVDKFKYDTGKKIYDYQIKAADYELEVWQEKYKLATDIAEKMQIASQMGVNVADVGGVATNQTLASLAKAAGFTDQQAQIMSAIAMAESGGRNTAHNQKYPDNSYGLWQINMLGEMGPQRRRAFGLSRNEQLFDPLTNAQAAKKVYDWQGYNAWSVYQSGAYKQYLRGNNTVTMGGGFPSLPPPGSPVGAVPTTAAPTSTVGPRPRLEPIGAIPRIGAVPNFDDLVAEGKKLTAESIRIKKEAFNAATQQVENSIRAAALGIDEVTASVIEGFVKPLKDANDQIKDRIAYEKEYGDLLRNGASPELATQLATLSETEKVQLRLLDIEQRKVEAAANVVREELKKKTLTDQQRKDAEGALKQFEAQAEALKGGRSAIARQSDAAIANAIEYDSPDARRARADTGYLENRRRLENKARPYEEYQKAKIELDNLTDPLNQLTTAANSFGDAFGQAFQDIVTGSKSASEAFSDMFGAIGASFAQMAAQMLAQKAVLAILGAFSGGGAAAAGPALPGFAPGLQLFAEGGKPPVGIPSIVGEEGPELFIPGMPGTIVPNDMVVPYSEGKASINPDGSTTYNASYPGAPGAPGSRGASGIDGQGRAGNSPLPALTVPFQKGGSGDQTLIQNLTESFGRQLVEMGSIKVAMDTTVINGMEFVTPEQAQQGNQQAAQQGAKIALAALQNSVGTRRKIGL